jgi:hypothetical protein
LTDRVATKKELRRQRRQEEKSRRARTARGQAVLIYGGLAVIAVLVIVLVFQQINPASQPGTAVLSQGNQHLQSIDEPHAPYNTVPPTSGPHMGGLAPWGISEAPIADELQIHNLEDGGVIVQYDCPEDSCADLEAELTDFVTQLLSDASLRNPLTGHTHLILAPYSGIRQTAASGGKPIALTAWTRIQYFDTVQREDMLKFIREYINDDHHVGGAG